MLYTETGLVYASTFLSHSSVDKELVEAVACELGRRGVIPWLDIHELSPGEDLLASIDSAIRQQATVTVFLSPEAVRSAWVEEELALTFKRYEEHGESERIIPVYIGEPLELVSAHPLLKERWLHYHGDRVNRLGIFVKDKKNIPELAREVADGIAQKVYKEIGTAAQREIVIYVDQRGTGKRRGKPADIPVNLQSSRSPALVFRPDLGTREQGSLLSESEWNSMRDIMENSLSEALSGVRWNNYKNILIIGNSQLSFPYMLGRYFNRNTRSNLFCTSNGNTFNNKEQERDRPLKGGNAYCEAYHQEITPIAEASRLDAISLLLSQDYLVSKVQRYLKAQGEHPPLVWVQSGRFEESQQVMQYVSDVVALLIRLNDKHGVRTVYLYCGLPFHVLPLLAANLLNIVDNIVFMEYRRDLQEAQASDEEMYVACPMKNC